MTTRLEKYRILDPRVDMSAEFRKWVSIFGPKETNLVTTPAASGANNSSSSFNIQLADNSTCVIDRSQVDLEVPMTILMTGGAVAGPNIYNPDFEGFRNRPLEIAMKKLDIRAAGAQAASFEPYLMVPILECFNFDEKQKQMSPNQIDNCQSYSNYNGTNASPFAKRYDNTHRVSRRAMEQITVVSNTFNSAELRTSLKMNLQDYPPFTNEIWHAGLNAQPLKLDISWIDRLEKMWCRDIVNHPQNDLTSIRVILGQPSIHCLVLTLPMGQQISNEQNFHYHHVDAAIVQTISNVASGADFSFDTGVRQLDFIPSRVYLAAIPNEGWVTTNLNRLVSTPQCFSHVKSANASFANRSGYFSDYQPQHFFQMAKTNGLIPEYGYCDWIGLNGDNNPYPLRGGPIAVDVVRDMANASKPITTGISEKTNLQFRGVMTNPSAEQRDWDILMITVYDGVYSIINRNLGVSNLGIFSSFDELKPLDIPFQQVASMMGGDARSFFRGLWSKIKDVLPIIKKSGVIGNIAKMIPFTAPIAPAIQTLGWGEGEGEGMYAYGEGEGMYAYGEGVSAGARRKKKAPVRRQKGGYLM